MIGMLSMGSLLIAKPSPIQIDKLLKYTFPSVDSVEKKMLVLSKEETKTISKQVRAKVDGTIYRGYIAKDKEIVVGYGVVVSQKVRTKKAVVLYVFDKNVTLQAMDILSFLEPHEYKPSSAWQRLFVDSSGESCTVITGATMSARMITQTAKIAKGVVEMKLR